MPFLRNLGVMTPERKRSMQDSTKFTQSIVGHRLSLSRISFPVLDEDRGGFDLVFGCGEVPADVCHVLISFCMRGRVAVQTTDYRPGLLQGCHPSYCNELNLESKAMTM